MRAADEIRLNSAVVNLCYIHYILYKHSILWNTPDLYCVAEQLVWIMWGSAGIWTLHRGSPCRHFVWPSWMTWASPCWRGPRGLNWFSGCPWMGSSGSQAKLPSSSMTRCLTVSENLGCIQNFIQMVTVSDFWCWLMGLILLLQCQKCSSVMLYMWAMKTQGRSQLLCTVVVISATSPQYAVTAGRGQPRSWWISTRGPTQTLPSSPSYQVV